MKIFKAALIISLISLFACSNSAKEEDNWINEPIRTWPDIALSNDVNIDSQVYSDYGSGFLVDTGKDTLAITSKQLLVAFVAHRITTVDFQNKLKSWEMHPKNHPKRKRISLGKLLNKDSKEFTAMPGSTSNTDWLIFKIEENRSKVKPLKISNTPLSNGDLLYAIGWEGEKRAKALVVAGSIIRMFDNQIFFELVNELENPEWFTGSPVINKSGEVVGVFSSINGTIARSCSVRYLSDILSDNK